MTNTDVFELTLIYFSRNQWNYIRPKYPNCANLPLTRSRDVSLNL